MEGFEESEYAAVSANDETSDGLNALNLKWVLGFNKDIYLGVHSLISADRTEIFYTAAHTGVIFNTETGEQKLLQGHCNKISCCTVSYDKKWIITADSGNDSMLVIWDSYSATPVKTIFTPHPTGTAYLDISEDSKFIVTLSASLP
jgi:WD40 repeat protein